MAKYLLLLTLVTQLSAAIRLKDLVALEGVRDNQLIGYGLVVGLNQTGDKRQTVFSVQSLTNLLQQMGVAVSPNAIRVQNTAAVMITSNLPPFSQPGTKIDVTVAAIGDASNLQGGLLVMSSLRGVNGQVYAMAQGPVVTGGFVAGKSQATQTVNHPTVGRIPNGAIIERAAPSTALSRELRLQLKQADFSNSVRIANAINKQMVSDGSRIADSQNPALVTVQIPASFRSVPEFVAALEQLTVETDRVAKIIVNERTGTIVMGKEVKISPVAIMHGTLTVQVETTFDVSQPAPLSNGNTQVVPKQAVDIKDEKTRNLVLKNGATIEELVKALSSIGSTSRDIIAILQNLRSAGALEGELEII
jgi:flagellar P-ring protein precursor FlgI